MCIPAPRSRYNPPMPFPAPALDAPMPPDLLRILRTHYLDPHGFWQFLPAATEVTPNTRPIAWHLLEILLYFFIAVACFTPFYLLLSRVAGGPSPELLLGMKIIAWTAALGVFAFAFIGRAIQVLLDLRRGPWLRILPAHNAIELPRHHLTIPFKDLEWTTLHAEHTVDRRPSHVTELTLTIHHPATGRCCISITARYGRRGLPQLDTLAQALATATHAALTRQGYPSPAVPSSTASTPSS